MRQSLEQQMRKVKQPTPNWLRKNMFDRKLRCKQANGVNEPPPADRGNLLPPFNYNRQLWLAARPPLGCRVSRAAKAYGKH